MKSASHVFSSKASLLAGIALFAMFLGNSTTSAASLPSSTPYNGTGISLARLIKAPAEIHNKVSDYLSEKWKLGTGYANTVTSAIFSAAHTYQLDPMLLLAIAAKESSFRHDISDNPHENYGIMQIVGKYHKEKFPGGLVKKTTVSENILMAAKVLREYLDIEHGNERRALLRYNGSLNISDTYYKKVNAFKERFLQDLHSAPRIDTVEPVSTQNDTSLDF